MFNLLIGNFASRCKMVGIDEQWVVTVTEILVSSRLIISVWNLFHKEVVEVDRLNREATLKHSWSKDINDIIDMKAPYRRNSVLLITFFQTTVLIKQKEKEERIFCFCYQMLRSSSSIFNQKAVFYK